MDHTPVFLSGPCVITQAQLVLCCAESVSCLQPVQEWSSQTAIGSLSLHTWLLLFRPTVPSSESSGFTTLVFLGQACLLFKDIRAMCECTSQSLQKKEDGFTRLQDAFVKSVHSRGFQKFTENAHCYDTNTRGFQNLLAE